MQNITLENQNKIKLLTSQTIKNLNITKENLELLLIGKDEDFSSEFEDVRNTINYIEKLLNTKLHNDFLSLIK